MSDKTTRPPLHPMPDDAELQALYREGVDELPSAALDARILKAARAMNAERSADKKRAASRRNSWWKNWLLPVSVTAVAVLGVSLSLRVIDEQTTLEAARMASEAPPATQRNDSANRNAAALESERPAGSEKKESAAKAIAPRPEEALAVGSAALADRAGTAAEGRLGALAPPVAPPAAAPSAVPSSPTPASAVDSRQAFERRRSDQPAGNLAAPSLKKSAASPDTAEADSTNASTASNESTPEKWLDEIRALRRSGRLAEAATQLDRFRQRYPDYRLPADLK